MRLNVITFTHIVAQNLAVDFAKSPSFAPNWTWKDNFTTMAFLQVQSQWQLAGRNIKIAEKNEQVIRKEIDDIAKDFSIITKRP